jgi:hypothetical protein
MLHLVHGRNNIGVTINDHGPYRRGRALDCTPAVDKALHLGGLGSVRVEYYPPLPKARPVDPRAAACHATAADRSADVASYVPLKGRGAVDREQYRRPAGAIEQSSNVAGAIKCLRPQITQQTIDLHVSYEITNNFDLLHSGLRKLSAGKLFLDQY